MARKHLPLMDRWARTSRTETLRPRTEQADRVVRSVCPYCGVGCGQLVYVKDDRITDIEGDPDSPISEGCLCPKGAATMQLVTGDHRERRVRYRRPGGTQWETLPLQTATEMVADRVQRTRDAYREERLPTGQGVARTMAIAHLGEVENQARI